MVIRDIRQDTSDFVLLSDMVPHIIQEIRYFSTYNFIARPVQSATFFCGASRTRLSA